MRNKIILLLPVLMMALLAWPGSSLADWHHDDGHHDDGHHDGGHHDSGHHERHDHDGRRSHSFFDFNFSLGPDYYYVPPYYYQPADVIAPPAAYQPVIINGATYYFYNGTYYVDNGYGYQPVPPPTTMAQPTPVIDNQEQEQAPTVGAVEAPADSGDSFTVNVPNNKGGYTSVTLKRSGSGYLGPQGEYYAEFPKVSHLKVLYGK